MRIQSYLIDSERQNGHWIQELESHFGLRTGIVCHEYIHIILTAFAFPVATP